MSCPKNTSGEVIINCDSIKYYSCLLDLTEVPIYTCGDTGKSTTPRSNSSGTNQSSSQQQSKQKESGPAGGGGAEVGGGGDGDGGGSGGGGGEDGSGSDDGKHSDTSEKDSESDSAVKTKQTPSKCRIVGRVRRKSVRMRNRSKSVSSASSSKASASLSKPERPKSMEVNVCDDSSDDEKDNKARVPLRANSKKQRKSFKANKTTARSTATHNAAEDQPRSTSLSDSKEDSDDIHPKKAAQMKFMTPTLVRVHDRETDVVSGSEVNIPRPKPKRTVVRSSGDELSYDSLSEIPTISSARPEPPSPTCITSQTPPSAQASATSVHTQEQASNLPPILPFPSDLPGPEEGHDLVQPMEHGVLVLLNREICFCLNQEVSCHYITVFRFHSNSLSPIPLSQTSSQSSSSSSSESDDK